MKKLTQICMLLLALLAFTGCDAAKNAANSAKDKAAGMIEMPDMGDFDMKGLTGQFNGITDGFKDVTTDSVDGLTSKISDLGSSIDGMGIDKLPAPAKTFVGTAMSKFVDTVKSAMGGITDDGILAKLKPAVDTLMEKVKAFM